MKIAISGIFYPLTIMHYFIRAFLRVDGIEITLVGPYTGDWIPWNGGMRLPQRYIIVPEIPLPAKYIGKNIPFSVVEKMVEKQDIWIQIDAGFHFATRPNADIVVHIQTDPHVLKNTYQKKKSYSDK